MKTLLIAGALLFGHVDHTYTHVDSSQISDKNLGNEVLYQIFVDRFADGNPQNDCLDGTRFCDRERRDFYKFWGGDLRGIIDHLPYLKRMGVTRLWLTPIFENQMITVTRNRHAQDIQMTPYHGYWIRDWFQLNPYFTDGGKRDYAIVDELIAKAQPEIKVLLDTVANHTSPVDPTDQSLAELERKEPLAAGQSHRGALFRDGQYVASWDDDQARRGADARFHHNGPITNWNDQNQIETYQLDGLNDFSQGNAEIADYLADAHDFWLTRFPGLAGFRMDTIKHVNMSYWRTFDRDLYAKHPETEIVGEWFGAGSDVAGSRPYYRETHQTMFDFRFRDTVIDVFLREQPISKFTKLWESDPQLGDARTLVTFVDNHDVQRVRGMGMSLLRLKQALALQFAARGVPCVYYGLEQDLYYMNDPGDPFNRPMMTKFDESAELYAHIKKLADLRKSNLALRYGTTHVVHESNDILAFERIHEGKRVFFATSKNKIAGSDDFDMVGLTLPDGDYKDVLSGKSYAVREGKVHVSLKNGDVILLASR